ncbi:DUF2058 domain-containing protein [Thiohalomonas denitrificans]|uniref:Nucleoprotein/polynucleotide-associated enzyme n=1 Tax=Thiohalomonas denitrificans TaxID=415747 RepID=A0A1G5QXE8_9GAMM|nr:DUF2058 domain-containing protein [Thiohalomonas denitrificans]SCZ66366.1 hypothetical protein SAMN03097708_02954 [Thiohalomonas denitrificans]
MSSSLRDQLMKSGLVDEKKAKAIDQSKRKKAKQKPKKQARGVDESRERHQQQQAEKAQRDRELNRRRQEETQRRAVVAQIKQLIEENRLPKRDGEIAFNFADGQKVKRLYINEQVHQQLTNGQAAVVKLHGQYDIVPRSVAEKIRERDESCLILCNEPGKDDDDPYADFPVPDDLMW